LQWLYLEGNQLSDGNVGALIPSLIKLPHLTTIDLSRNPITPGDVELRKKEINTQREANGLPVLTIIANDVGLHNKKPELAGRAFGARRKGLQPTPKCEEEQ
jgi:Leucine-rich repeat (LRR) protein